MRGPVLLVHDDIALIAAVRRLLARDGYEVVLASSVSDALIAYGYHQPPLMLLAPALEGGRGHLVLEELREHPEGLTGRVLLLGEAVPGFGVPVAPLPLDGPAFLAQVRAVMEGRAGAAGWQVLESGEEASPSAPASNPALESALFGDLAPLDPADWESPATAPQEATSALDGAVPAADTSAFDTSAGFDAETWGAAEELHVAHPDAPPAPGADAWDAEGAGASSALEDPAFGTPGAGAEGSALPPETPWDPAGEAPPQALEAGAGTDAWGGWTPPAADGTGWSEPGAPAAAHDAPWGEADAPAAAERAGWGEPGASTAPVSLPPWSEDDAPAAQSGGDVAAETGGERTPWDAQGAGEGAAPQPGHAPWDDAPAPATPAAWDAPAGEGGWEPSQPDALSGPGAQDAEAGWEPQASAPQATVEAHLAAVHAAAQASDAQLQQALLAAEEARAEQERLLAEAQAQLEVALEEAARDREEAGAGRQQLEAALEEVRARAAVQEAELEELREELAQARAEAEAARREVEETLAAQRVERDRLTEALHAAEVEQAAARAREEELEALRGQLVEAHAQAESRASEAGASVEGLHQELAAVRQELEAVQQELAAARQAARTREAGAARLRAAVEERERLRAEEASAREQAEAALAEREAGVERLRQELEAAHQAASAAALEHEAEAEALREALALAEAARQETESASVAALTEECEHLRAQVEELREASAALVARHAAEVERLERLAALREAQHAEALLGAANASAHLLAEARAEGERRAQAALQQAQLAEAQSEERRQLAEALAAETARAEAAEAVRAGLEARLAEVEQAHAAQGQEREAALGEARRAREEAEQLLARAVGGVGVAEARSPTGPTRGGALDRERLVGLMLELHLRRPEARLEVKAGGALRVLYFREGALLGATSTAPDESLLERARRDGLLDARQLGELRLLRGVSATELLRVLRERGYVREAEVLPLVQRHTEQVALEALAQTDGLYRLSDERTPSGLALAAATRPPLALLAEALRASFAGEPLLAQLGGLRAVPERVTGAIPLEELGFSEPELRLLWAVDGGTSLEQLLLGAGMRQEAALRALALARLYGVLAVGDAPAGEEEAVEEVDVRRLLAKHEEVQEADYFTVLGVSRSAGSAEVRRAYELLAREFHPLRFAGHPDVTLQGRAQAIHAVLEEARRALEDDALRAEYARNLLD